MIYPTIAELTKGEFLAVVLHHFKEATDMVPMHVGEKPGVDMGNIAPRLAAEGFQKLRRVLAEAAVHEDGLAALGADKKAVHLRARRGGEHGDGM